MLKSYRTDVGSCLDLAICCFDGGISRYCYSEFAGHTRTDDFRLFGAPPSKSAFVLINPAISPIDNRNPAFRVVTFESDGSLSDQSTYYLTNLERASSKTPGRWKKEYQFSQEWKAREVDGVTLGAIYGRIRAEQKFREKWLNL